MGRVVEAGGQVVGNRDRVEAICGFLERASDPNPRAGYAENLAEDDPESMDAYGITHAGEPEEQPGTLARGVRAEGDDPRGKAFARDVVALEAPGLPARPETDAQQDDEVYDED